MAIGLLIIIIAAFLFLKIPHVWKVVAAIFMVGFIVSNTTVDRFGGMKRTCVFGDCTTSVDR